MDAHLAAVFATSFIFVALKAFQQLNVVHDAKALVFVTSVLMGLAEVFLITTYVKVGADLALGLTVGVGAGLGCLSAMWFRKRVVK